MRIEQLSQLFECAKTQLVKKMVIVNAVDCHSIEAAYTAVKMGIVQVILTGDRLQILSTCKQLKIEPDTFELIEAASEDEAASISARMVQEGKADILMKGLISSDKYMRALLNKEFGLVPKKNVLSHIAVIRNEKYHKLLIASDVAVIPYPNLDQKVAICNYLIRTAHTLGIVEPKLALIAPSEKVIPSIPACADAALIAKMAHRGQIVGALIDGPMGLDVALDMESAEIKKISSPVAGDADCLLFPNIDAGNVFYKMNAKLCTAELAAVVVGAKVPAVLSSRGDSTQTKLNSIALAALLSN